MTVDDLPSNERAAYGAGIRGWPSPDVASPHNYTTGEMAAWKKGREERRDQQKLG